MKFANVRDLKINSRTIIKKLIKEDVVITNRGKPVAAVVYLDEDLLDSFIIAHHPTLLSGIERDIQRWRSGRLKTLSLERVRTRLLGDGKRGKRSP